MRPSVLLVDDNLALREALARSLTRRGCQVASAKNGFEALAMLASVPVDIVVTDLNMPGRDGLWVWREALLVRPQLRGRFVLIASEPLPDPAALSRFLESERYLVKPFSTERLWEEIQGGLSGVPLRAAPRRTEPRRLGGRAL